MDQIPCCPPSSGAATPSDFQPAIVTGNYYISQSTGGVSTTMTYSTAGILDNIAAYPIWFSHTETWTRIGTFVDSPSSTPGAVVRFGIWENATGNLPGDLVVDSGDISLESYGNAEATISALLTANTLYWIGALANAADAALPIGTSSMFAAIAGGSTDVYGNGYQKTQTYGALPDPFGTPDGQYGSSSGQVPIISLRKV